MQNEKVRQFITLAGQKLPAQFSPADPALRQLGAQLLLSETLEYVIKGLGVIPMIDGVAITKPDGLSYEPQRDPNHHEMLDGLADVAYTMYWNQLAFGLKLEEAFDAVCDNNLEKFVKLGGWAEGKAFLAPAEWDCRQGITWPSEVASVAVIEYRGEFYAVGKDSRGKVRKPSSYQSVNLAPFLG